MRVAKRRRRAATLGYRSITSHLRSKWRDLTLEPSPGLLPLRVVHAVVLAVAARGDRGLPEVDLLEVRERSVGVVLRAGALGELVHPGARLAVHRRLTEVDRLLGLHLRRRDPREPLVGA